MALRGNVFQLFKNVITNMRPYCDPPYAQTEDCYQVEFSKEDYQRLHNVLLTCQGKAILLLKGHYLMVSSSWPPLTVSPSLTSTVSTVPSIRAVMAVSIFMAAMVTRVWVFHTRSPAFTAILLTAPGMDAPT